MDGKQKYIKDLIELRDDYSEEMPEELVRSHPATHKVQRNWFNDLFLLLFCADSDKFFSPDAGATVTQFSNYLTSNAFKDKRRTAKEDIERANAIIKIAIDDLMRSPEKKLSDPQLEI